MTSIIHHDEPGASHVYTDSAVRNRVTGEPRGYTAKAAALPHVNAIFTGCGHPWINRYVMSRVLCHHVDDFRDMGVRLRNCLREARDEFVKVAAEEGEELGPDGPAAMCMLAIPGQTIAFNPDQNFKAIPLPRAVWVDPWVEGEARFTGASIPDDEAAADLMRKARADNPERHIGGPCVRYTVKPGGIEVVTVGAAEGEPTGAYRRITDPENAPRENGAAATARPQRGRAKPGRNDPCPCGSGRKFKRCCGA